MKILIINNNPQKIIDALFANKIILEERSY